MAGFGQLPFDGRWAGLSILLRLQVNPGLDDALAIACVDGFGAVNRRPGSILIPVRFSALVAFEPFEKPVLGPIKIAVYVFRGFSF